MKNKRKYWISSSRYGFIPLLGICCCACSVYGDVTIYSGMPAAGQGGSLTGNVVDGRGDGAQGNAGNGGAGRRGTGSGAQGGAGGASTGSDCTPKLDSKKGCGFPNALAKCEQSQCVIAQCTKPYGNCDRALSNGCETPLNTMTDCGECNERCLLRSCAGGACSELSCASGLADCNMDRDDGCETSLTTLTDCTMCGQRCVFANSSATCAIGKCEFVECKAGFADCDNDLSNGCETALNTLTDCGACGKRCDASEGELSCRGGLCSASACDEGFADCNGDTSDGCEVSLRSLEHCGSCDEGAACGPLDHATASCSSGTCDVESCAAGYGDCDGEPANGCETALNTNQNCGGCRITCGFSDAITSCETGTCQFIQCSDGYGECNQSMDDGCEASFSAVSTCGSCSNNCSQLPNINEVACNAGSCSVQSCSAGYADCNAEAGCETPLGTTTNCASCGDQCPALPDASYPHASQSTCREAVCRIAECETGYGDCNGNLNDGCEINLQTDTSNCNSCGNTCGPFANATAGCAGGTCGIVSCAAPYDDCDDTPANGCETPLDTASNCGSCGHVCPANGGTPVCNAGVCGTVCTLTGTFALKLTVPVNWAAKDWINAGSGTFYSWSRLQGTHVGNSVTGALTECAKDAPHFESSFFNGEFYKHNYPAGLFDHSPAYLPSASTTATLGSAAPGATYQLAPTALLMGATMADPINGAWSGLTSADMDDNGKPGVSVDYRNSGNDRHAPTSASMGADRADTGYVATRLAFSLNGTLTSCAQSAGSATVTHIDTRIFGCHLEGGSECSGSEGTFLNNNQVAYQQTGAATYTLVKIADTGTCADVRAAVP